MTANLMTARLGYRLALATLALGLVTQASALELDPAAVVIKTPDQFKWRNPNMQAPNNAQLLGDPTKVGSIYAHINSFVPGRFGNPHYHPNERYIVVLSGAPWRGTGPVVDPAHATRVPKGTFMIDHAKKVHWDGTKDEGGAYFITGIGPSTQTEVAKKAGPWDGGDPAAVTIKLPDQIVWTDNGPNRTAVLAGDPAKPGFYVTMFHRRKGNFGRPHIHPNDRFLYVLEGTWRAGTGNKVDANLAVPAKAGSLVSVLGKGVHWDGTKDEDVTVLFFGEGPATNIPVQNAK